MSQHQSMCEKRVSPTTFPILLAGHILPDALDFGAATSGETLPPPEGGMLPSRSLPCLWHNVFSPGISRLLLLSRQGWPRVDWREGSRGRVRRFTGQLVFQLCGMLWHSRPNRMYPPRKDCQHDKELAAHVWLSETYNTIATSLRLMDVSV